MKRNCVGIVSVFDYHTGYFVTWHVIKSALRSSKGLQRPMLQVHSHISPGLKYPSNWDLNPGSYILKPRLLGIRPMWPVSRSAWPWDKVERKQLASYSHFTIVNLNPKSTGDGTGVNWISWYAELILAQLMSPDTCELLSLTCLHYHGQYY